MAEPILLLQSDPYFKGQALRPEARAYAAEEEPVGAVVVRAGRIIAHAFNQAEQFRFAAPHGEAGAGW